MVQQNKEQNIEKLNEERRDPIQVETQDVVFRKENRRNKLTPRFSKQTALTDGGLTVTTHKRQKIHKSKIKTQLPNIKPNNYTKMCYRFLLTASQYISIETILGRQQPVAAMQLDTTRIIHSFKRMYHVEHLSDYQLAVDSFNNSLNLLKREENIDELTVVVE